SQVRWAHEVIDRQIRHLEHLLDDLLDLGRINTGKIAVRQEPTDFADVVARVAESVRATFLEKQQTLDLILPEGPVVVSGDETRLWQVVLNLLTNAHKYTRAGGHVAVAIDLDAAHTQLTVRDDGIGMPA